MATEERRQPVALRPGGGGTGLPRARLLDGVQVSAARESVLWPDVFPPHVNFVHVPEEGATLSSLLLKDVIPTKV